MSITVEQLDQLVRDMREKRLKYEELSAQSKQAHAEYVEADQKLLHAMQALGKKSYKLDGVGTYSVVSTLKVPTPKTIEDKRALMQYISSKYGQDVVIDKFSINHNTLNSFYKEEYAACPDDQKPFFTIPGLEAPVEETYSKWLSERARKV